MCTWLKSLSGWCQEVGKGERVESHTQRFLSDLQTVTTGRVCPVGFGSERVIPARSQCGPVCSIAAMTFLWLVDWSKGGSHRGLKWRFCPHLHNEEPEANHADKGKDSVAWQPERYNDVSLNMDCRAGEGCDPNCVSLDFIANHYTERWNYIYSGLLCLLADGLMC